MNKIYNLIKVKCISIKQSKSALASLLKLDEKHSLFVYLNTSFG